MSDTETQPVVDAVEEGKKQEKKQKNVQQLAEARLKKAQKKKELDEERQADKKRLAELEQRLTQQAVAKVEADSSSSSDTEPDELPKKTTVVTKQPPLETDDEDLQPSFADEVKKVALMGALSLASFLVARKFNSSNTTSKPNVATPPTPKPAKRPAPQPTDGFIQPPAKRHIQPFAVPLPKTPVGTSGFFK